MIAAPRPKERGCGLARRSRRSPGESGGVRAPFHSLRKIALSLLVAYPITERRSMPRGRTRNSDDRGLIGSPSRSPSALLAVFRTAYSHEVATGFCVVFARTDAAGRAGVTTSASERCSPDGSVSSASSKYSTIATAVSG